MQWEKVLREEELTEGARRIVTVGGRDILIVSAGGHVYAVADSCPHMKLPLKRGKVTDDAGLVCPWHRSVFDLETGAVRDWVPWPPGVRRALGAISRGSTLPVFASKVENGSIWVGL